MTATRVLVLNSGSSSVRYQLLEMADGSRQAAGIVERIGERQSRLVHSSPASGGETPNASGGETPALASGGERRERVEEFADHDAALRAVARELEADGCGLEDPRLAAIGHRVVHGGQTFTRPTLVDDAVLAEIERLIPLAPLHNPANLTGITTARSLNPGLPQVAVFDTTFHTTMPEHAARYAIDTATADEHLVRRYGFHGTSHAYVSRRTAEMLGKDPSEVNVIVLHLGNGASASAVRAGRCVDTSMGLTPLEGLVMGTRSGDVDPAVVLHLVRVAGMSVDGVDQLLNKRSGLVGLCGDNDMREIRRRVDEGEEEARLAFDIYVHRLKKYIGAYCAVLGRVDAVAFTAGVGENSAPVRRAALQGLEGLGLSVDDARNEAEPEGPAPAGARIVSPDGAPVAVAVVPTDEELEIARQTYELVSEAGSAAHR
ncbi:acetate kinase [Streptomyces abyssalis]|uniref:Acetate kinase n=1 Tax=Streptomyces abyssalis TaxID=933944 RepID=A0A1E7JIQ8_9ACTN|nr:acetate kinase [Streptomyces abyssalis]OEU86356.1 acetate kinase [Streptomyces abyssalis]OEU93290.1 acetate kinase [Streptomyces abyssalis]